MTENEKWLYTMQVYDDYERRFAKARIEKDEYLPTDENARARIIARIKEIIGFDENKIPSVHAVEEIHREKCEKYDIIELRYMTWENFYGIATYYEPHNKGPHPLAFTLCGHGNHGRRTETYATMARRLANLGFASIVLDNIGQGDRESLGHWSAYAPLALGISLQGMIVMETIGVIRYMTSREEIDSSRIVACGNSGGGTLTLLLSALAPELSAIASAGYPSEFHYILSKERNHCSCNILPGIAHGPEMWEVLSCFAPKPLMIEQGLFDDLIPYDYFERCARKVAHCYRALGAERCFTHEKAATKHPWEESDISIIAKFLTSAVGLPFTEGGEFISFESIAHKTVTIPENALTTAEMAEILTGKKLHRGDVKYSDIFYPKYKGLPVDKEKLVENIGRGEVLEILAQMEATLWEGKSWGV